MPAGNATRWRTFPQYTHGELYIHIPDVILKRRVNGTGFVYPLQEIPYDNPDAQPGSHLDVLDGYTLNVYTSAGELKGNVRVRSADASTLYIAPTTKGDIAFADNDILEVVMERRLWVEIPLLVADGTSYKDYTQTFPSEDFQQPPVANGGPDVARKVDAVTGLITVEFDWTNSFSVAQGATIASYLCDPVDGTFTVGDENSSTCTITFPVGVRYVRISAIDSNDASHSAYVMVAAIDNETVFSHPCRRARLGGSVEDGWEGSFELIGGNLEDIPFGAKVIFFVTEKYGSVVGGVNGYPDREDIHFVGWISRDLLNPSVRLGTRYTISAQNTQAFMAFSQTTSLATSPVNWFEMKNLTWFRHLHYLIHWHSNLLDLQDFERPSYYAEYPSRQLDAQAGTLEDQINFLAQAVRAKWTCDHQGRCYVRLNPHQMDDAEQAALTSTVSLTAADWLGDPGPQLEYRHRDEMGWVRGTGVLASDTVFEEYEAVAPGSIPRGEGSQRGQLDRQLVADWEDLLYRVARFYKFRNLRLKGITLQMMAQGIMVDPAWQEWVPVTVDAAGNDRGIGFTAKKFVAPSVTIEYGEAGIVEQSWRLENTPGLGVEKGVAVPAPGQDPPVGETEYLGNSGTLSQQIPLPWNYVAPIPYIPDILTTSDPVVSELALAFNANGVVVTVDTSVSSPDWTLVFSPAGAETVVDVV